MATVEDLFAALKAADAAGNTEDATKIAQYLSGLGYGPKIEAAPPKKETGFKDYLKDIPKAVGRGATGLLETSAIGASALLPEDYEKSVRAGIESLAKPTREYLAPATPEIGESVSSKLLSGVGSTLPFFVAGPLGLAGRVGAGALGVSAGAGEARQAAEQAGATPEEISRATALGAPTGMLDILAPNIGPLKSIFTTALARGGVEGLTEAAQKVAQNYIAKGVYDPKKDVLEGSGEEGVYGAGVGALTSLLVDLTLGRRAKGAVTPPPERPPAAAAAPEAPAALGLPSIEAQPARPGFSAQQAQDLRQEAEQLEQMRQQAIEQNRLDDVARIEAAMLAQQERVAGMSGFTRSDGNVAIRQAMEERRQAEEDQVRAEAVAAERQRQAQIRQIQAATFDPDPVRNELIKRRELERLGAGPAAPAAPAAPAEPAAPAQLEEPAGLYGKREPLETEPQAKPRGVQKFEFTPEEQAEIKSVKESLAAINKDITAAKAQKTSLFKALEGKLTFRPGSINLADIDVDKKSLRRLYNKEGKGALLEDMVEDGALDDFLPPENRKLVGGQENPRFDSQAAIDHITGKLRSGDYTSEIEAANLAALEQQRDAAKAELEKLETLPAINRELAAGRRPAEPSLQDLMEEAANTGLDVEAIKEDVARRMPDATDAQYRGALYNALTAATSKEPLYEKYALISANPEQSKNANAHAKDFGGSVVYQNGDIGLVQAYSAINGDPVYIPFKGEYRVGKDIESIQTNPLNLTPEQKKELSDARKQVIEEESKRKETVVKFDKDGLGFSKDIDPRMVSVLRGWKKMLNIPNNVYITTIEDARANSKNFTGPYRRIGSAALDPNAEGTMRHLGNGEYYITFTKSTSVGRMLEVLAHELGHIHEVVVFNNASPEMKKAIVDEYNKWLKSNQGKTAREHIESMRAKRFARSAAAKTDASLMSSEMRSYWRRFDEWYADQVSRWATTQEKPLSVVEKFFAKLGAALKRFFNSLRGKNFLPSETFIDYMDRVTSSAKSDAAPIASVGQMEMFALEKPILGFATKEPAPVRTQMGNDAMEMLEGIGRSVAPPEPGYIQKVRQSWDNARDNPKATREAAYGAFRKFADQVETWSFSSDAALNNQIRREVMNSMVGNEQKIGMLLNTSLSQTAHSDAIANLFLMEGNIKYDTELHKWVGVKDDRNIFNLSKKLDEIAEKHGLTKEQIELIAHTAFEARRTQELNEFNDNIDAQVEAMRAEARAMRAAGKPVAASALSDKAQALLAKRKNTKNMPAEKIQTGMQFFKMFPELNEVSEIWNGIRSNALDVMVDTGLYTREEADMLMDAAGYVPFFREDQIEEGKGPKEFLRSLAVQADKGLKGSEKPVNDIFDNMVRWTQYAINRGVRNRSGVALATTAEKLGLANKIHDKNNPDNIGIGFDEQGNPMLEKVSGRGVIPFNTPAQASQARATQDSLKDYGVLAVEVEQDGKMVKRYVLSPPMPADNLVYVWQDGERVGYNMADPLFMSAFRGLESVAIPTVKVFSKMADVLRQSVVLYPLFSIAQVPQDSFAAMFTSGLKPQYALSIPFRAVKEFIQTLRGKSKAHEELKNIGAVGVRDFTSAVIRADAEIFAGLKQEKSFWAGVKRKLGNLAMAADNAVRQATFEAAEAQGLSKAEAYEKAFEIFNVRRRGNSKMLALAGQVIPFFNAYLAAQHVAYRTLTGVGTSPTERKAAFQTLAATTGSVMALSVLYAMMNGDDEDYLNKPTPTRDRLLMIPGSGGFSIPLRADIFALPKVVAEHTYMLLTDNGYEDSAKFRASLASLLANSILSPTPVPQAIKPLTEAIINYDFFQQKPLVGLFQQKKELGRQFEDSTSEISKLLGKTGVVSPIVADHLIRGMFGSFGGLLMYMTNPILAEMSGTPRPSLSFQDALATIPNASGFVSKEYESALRKDFYALREVTERAASTLSDLKQRSPQDIADYLSDETVRQRVALAPAVNQIATQLTNIRKAVTMISQASEDRMDEDEKQRQIKQLREAERQLLQGVNLKKLREMANL